jgi:hypothetical protein
MLAKMTRECLKRDIQPTQTTFYYGINLTVKTDQKYTIYIPKLYFY